MASKPAPPPRLAELQGWLARVWTTPAGVDAALKTPHGSAAARWVTEAPPLKARDRLAVYSDAYFSRLLESLGADFPAVKRVLGEGDFRVLVAAYLEGKGSDSPNITDLGRGLLAAAARHALSKRHPYLGDLCRLEWAVLSAIFTDRLPALDPEVFARVADWDKVRLVFDPTVRLLACGWPVDRLWRNVASRSLPKAQRKTWLLVYRDDEWARVVSLEERAYKTIERILDGAALGAACAKSGAHAAEIQAWFTSWAQDGLVKGVR